MKTALHPYPIVLTLTLTVGLTPLVGAGWRPAEGPLATRWAAELDPARVLPEYPRPHYPREVAGRGAERRSGTGSGVAASSVINRSV